MAKLDVIGLSGKIGTGKDFLAKTYIKPMGYHPFSLAFHFKVWIVGKGEATHEEIFVTKPPRVRDLLQQEGTERGRLVYGQNVWVDTMFEWMDVINESWGINKFVVPDVRFKNEVMGIQNRGGRVFRIVAPNRDSNSGASVEARYHISETDLDDFPIENFNGLIFNDTEYASTVGMQVSTLLHGSPIVYPKPERPELRMLREGHLEDWVDGVEDTILQENKMLEMIGNQFDKMGDQLEKVYHLAMGRKHA